MCAWTSISYVDLCPPGMMSNADNTIRHFGELGISITVDAVANCPARQSRENTANLSFGLRAVSAVSFGGNRPWLFARHHLEPPPFPINRCQALLTYVQAGS